MTTSLPTHTSRVQTDAGDPKVVSVAVEPSVSVSDSAPQRRRWSAQEVREALIDAALGHIVASGLTVSIEHVSFEALIRSAKVPRSAAYRAWPYKEHFLGDVLRTLTHRGLHTTIGVSRQVMREVCEIVLQRAHDLHDARTRLELGLEIARMGSQENFLRLQSSREWHTYLAANAAAVSVNDPELRRDVDNAIVTIERRWFDAVVVFYDHMLTAIGFIPKPGIQEPAKQAAIAISGMLAGLQMYARIHPWVVDETMQADLFDSGVTRSWSVVSSASVGALLTYYTFDPDAEVDASQAVERIREYLSMIDIDDDGLQAADLQQTVATSTSDDCAGSLADDGADSAPDA